MFSSAANCGVLASVLPLWLWECGAEPPCSVWLQGCTSAGLWCVAVSAWHN